MLTLDDFQYLFDGQVAIVVHISVFNPLHKGRRKCLHAHQAVDRKDLVILNSSHCNGREEVDFASTIESVRIETFRIKKFHIRRWSPIGLTPPTHLFKTMADVEKDTYSVSMLMQLKSMTPSLARRIKDADVDRDGQLSVEEIVKAIESEQTAAEDAHMMKWMVVGTLALLVILLGTHGGGYLRVGGAE
ncbi:hypothetical protein Ndes2526B_g06647 [Nannochloris sp. 'desiccata']